MKRVAISCSEIAHYIGAELRGDGATLITTIAPVDGALAGSITFVTGKKFNDALQATKATAVILPPAMASATDAISLLMDNPYLGYARLTRLWHTKANENSPGGVHSTAHVSSDNMTLGKNLSIGAQSVIESDVTLGNEVVIGAGAFVGQGSRIGDGTVIHPNATLLSDCKIGNDCEIHSGAVIGADGFGYAPGGEHAWEKIYQLGGVSIGDRVSIGACTTVDRGALEDTVIESGVILDNHVQVAHNVLIGANTAIAGCTGIAGSTRIGSNCRIGGAVSIVGHISICSDVTITANSFVNNSVTEPGSYSSGFPLESTRQWRKNAVRLHRLDELSRQVGKLKP